MGWGGQTETSVGGVWIFSGTTFLCNANVKYFPLIDVFHYGFILGCQRRSSRGGF